ncbi:MAG: GNAT family N-acetyltransferase [Alphaproteobacteria bacterium]
MIRIDNLRLRDFPGIYRIAVRPDFFYAFLNQNRRPPWSGTLRFMWLCFWTRWRRPRHWFKAVRTQTDGKLIGCVLILDLHVVEAGLGEIAYFIAAPEQGRGIGSTAVISTVRWACRHHGLRRLQAHVDPENYASLSILKKLGFGEGRNLPSNKSQFFDRAGSPRPQFVLTCHEPDLTAALGLLPPEQDYPVG